jgi:hypothetical protein
MADNIGELGIDTSSLEDSMDAAAAKITELGTEAVETTGSLAGLALVAAGALAKGIYESWKRAEELEDTLSQIEQSDPFNSKLVGLSEYQDRLKSIRVELQKIDDIGIQDRIFDFVGSARLLGGEGFDAKQAEQEEQRNRLLKEQDDTLRGIADKEKDQLEVLKLRLKGDEEGAEILKMQLSYKEKIGAATREGNADLAVTLKQEMQVSEELIKQKGYKEQAAREMKAEAEERDKRFKAEAQAFEKSNKEEVANFKKEQKEYDAAKQAGLDTDKQMIGEAIKFRQEKEEERIKSQREMETKEYKTWLETKNRMESEAYDNAEENRKFKEKKREEAIDEKLKSPDQRRAESREAAKRDRTGRAIDKAAQEAENTRAKNEGRKARDLKADVPGNGADGKKPADGFTTTDSQNLQKIAAALAVRS